MGHHQGCFARIEARHDVVPSGQRTVPHLLDRLPPGHLHRFRGPLPVAQELGPAFSDLLLQATLPEAMADLHQATAAGEGHARVGAQDHLGRLAGTGHRARVGPLDRHIRQKDSGRFGLGQAVGVEGDVDLPLKPALAIPVGLAVAHQQQARAGSLGRQGLLEVGDAVMGFDLHIERPSSGAADVEHRDGGVVEAEPAEAPDRQPQQLQHQAPKDGVVGHHQHRLSAGSVETVLMVGQEAIGEAPGLIHQLQKRVIAPPIGVLKLHRFGCFPPAALLFRSLHHQILAP